MFGGIFWNVWPHSPKLTFPHSPHSSHSVPRSCIPGFIHNLCFMYWGDQKYEPLIHIKTLLGITLDKNLNFESHIENICCKANKKLKALFRIQSFLTLEEAKVLAEASILSNFRYCPLVWMFCGKCSNNLIMQTHYRRLRAIYNTQAKTYRYLPRINGKIDIHRQNIEILMIEMSTLNMGLL